MRILVAHNRYRFSGGEDSVVQNEVEMLRSGGHEIETLEADNRVIEGTLDKIAAAASVVHSEGWRQRLESRILAFRPDVVHVHNWFPLMSPSLFAAAAERGVPVVQTLHNYRMVCAGANLFRDGSICCDCIGKKLPIAPVLHGCYAGSRLGSAVVASAFAWHRFAGTWNSVSLFIALTEFQRDLLIRGGLDPSRTIVKPNFVRRTGTDEVGTGRGGFALFVGRLVPEKGIRTVLRAWEENVHLPRLKIMGDGPLIDEVRSRALLLPHVQFLGRQPKSAVAEALADARLSIFASEGYEAFPLAVLESLAAGTPVIAAELPSLAEILTDGETGLHFEPGNATDLAAKVAMIRAETSSYREMRRHCRLVYQQRYTESINYELLMSAYARAGARASAQLRLQNEPGSGEYEAVAQ